MWGKRISKFFLWLAAFILLVLLLLPPVSSMGFVQNKLKKEIPKMAAAHTGFALHFDKIQLGYYNQISIKGFVAIDSLHGSHIEFDKLKVHVRLLALLGKKAVVKVKLGESQVILNPASFKKEGQVSSTSKEAQPDKTSSKWKLKIAALELGASQFILRSPNEEIIRAELDGLLAQGQMLTLEEKDMRMGKLEIENGYLKLRTIPGSTNSEPKAPKESNWKFYNGRLELMGFQFEMESYDSSASLYLEGTEAMAKLQMLDLFKKEIDADKLQLAGLNYCQNMNVQADTSNKLGGKFGWQLVLDKLELEDCRLVSDVAYGTKDSLLLFQHELTQLDLDMKDFYMDSILLKMKMPKLYIQESSLGELSIEDSEFLLSDAKLDFELQGSLNQGQVHAAISAAHQGIDWKGLSDPSIDVQADGIQYWLNGMMALGAVKIPQELELLESIHLKGFGTAGDFQLDELVLMTAQSEIKLKGRLINYSSFPETGLQADLITSLHLKELGSLFQFNLPDSALAWQEAVSLSGKLYGNLDSLQSYLQVDHLTSQATIDGIFGISDSIAIHKLKLDLVADTLNGYKLGFPLNRLVASMQVDGYLDSLAYLDYQIKADSFTFYERDYGGLVLSGQLNAQLLEGLLSMQDESIRFELQHQIALVDSIRANIQGKVFIDSIYINEGKEDVDLSTSFDLDFVSSEESMLFSANFDTILIHGLRARDTKGSMDIYCKLTDEISQARISSPWLLLDFSSGENRDVLIENLTALATGFNIWEGDQFYADLEIPQMNVSLNMQEIELFQDLELIPAGIKYEKIIGELVSVDSLLAKLNIEGVGFNGFKARQFDLGLKVSQNKASLSMETQGLEHEQSQIGQFKLNAGMQPQEILLIPMVANKDGQNAYEVPLQISKLPEGIAILPGQERFLLSGREWQASAQDSIVFVLRQFVKAGLKLQRGDMFVDLQSNDDCSVELQLENISLSGLGDLFLSDTSIAGQIDGKLCYRADSLRQVNLNLSGEGVAYANHEIGNIGVSGLLEGMGGQSLNAALEIRNAGKRQIGMEARLLQGQKIKLQYLEANIDSLALVYLTPLLSPYLHELSGYVNGEVLFDSELKGSVRYHDLGFNPKLVNSYLSFKDNSIELSSKKIRVKDIIALNEHGRMLTIHGELNVVDEQPLIDLDVISDSMLIFNVAPAKDRVLHGQIMASNKLTMKGPLDQPSIHVDIDFLEGTDLNYKLMQDLSEHSGDDAVTFVSETSLDSLAQDTLSNIFKPASGIELIARVRLDPKSKFRLLMDDAIRLSLDLQGGGNLNYSINKKQEESLVGAYTVNSGKVSLKMQGVARRDFVIQSGSFVRWEGDVEKPMVQIDARYPVKGSYINPASPNSESIIVDYEVMFQLEGDIEQPQVSFDVVTQDNYMTSVLNNMPEEERMKQAINLLVIGAITTPETQSSSSNLLTEQVNQFWANQLNNIAAENFSRVDVSVDIQSFTDYREGKSLERTDLSYEVQKEVWNDRALIKVGGWVSTYDDPKVDAPSRMIGDVSMEYRLGKGDNWYAKLFSEHKYEGILEGEIQRNGAGVMYKQRYTSFGEIWRRKRTKEMQERNKHKTEGGQGRDAQNAD